MEVVHTVVSTIFWVIIPFVAIIFLIGYTIYSFKSGEYSIRLSYELEMPSKIYLRYGLYYTLPKILISFFFFILLLLIFTIYPDLHQRLYDPENIKTITISKLFLWAGIINILGFGISIILFIAFSSDPGRRIRWKISKYGESEWKRILVYVFLYLYFLIVVSITFILFQQQYSLNSEVDLIMRIVPLLISFVFAILFTVIIETSLVSKLNVYKIEFLKENGDKIEGYFICRYKHEDFLIRNFDQDRFELIPKPDQSTKIILTEATSEFLDRYRDFEIKMLQEYQSKKKEVIRAAKEYKEKKKALKGSKKQIV